MNLRTRFFAPAFLAVAFVGAASAQVLSNSFDNLSQLLSQPNPWVLTNNSVTPGTNWSQGNTGVFAAQGGTGFLSANYLSTSGITGTETISNWLISPVVSFQTGDLISFFSRTEAGSTFPDHLELRLSFAGASTNTGGGAGTVGDFSTLLLDINPSLAAGGYPEAWTQFMATLSGIPAGSVGRFAFRYTVPNSGVNGINGNFVGVDTLTTSVVVVPEPATVIAGLGALSVVGVAFARRRKAAVATQA